MSEAYEYRTVSSSLTVSDEHTSGSQVLALPGTRAEVSGAVYKYVSLKQGHARVSTFVAGYYTAAMDALFEDLASIAVSGELVVIREDECGATPEYPPVKYIVTPGRVRKVRSHVLVVWEE